MTTPEVALRAAIDAMPAYVPGARPAAGAAPLVKLSSNENPYPPHPAVVAAVHRAGAAVNRYPDMYAAELVEAIAARHGRPASGVVVGNGSVSVLSHVLDAVCEAGDEVVFPWRSFEAYPIAVATARATGVRVPLTVDGRHDLAAMSAAVTDRTRAVLLCSPNNPTGPALRSDELRAFLASVRGDVLVLLDEAYAEFVRDPDAVDGPGFLAQWPNLVVLRTFSKAYGLAGLRVGYALAAQRLAAGIRAVSTPFGVNGVAQEAALAALGVEEDLSARVARIVAERQRVVAALADLGQEVPDAQGNFFWLPLGERSAELAAHAREAGVLVRPFAGEGVRVSIGTPEENDAFLTAMRDWA
jgi:histidinol-phosphate aminotransferase